MRKPKIVLWDIETSGIIAETWNLYPQSIPHTNVMQDWFIICAAWKELGKKTIHSVSVMDDPKRFKRDVRDDYHVVKALRDMLEGVDIIVHHNGNKFDIKAFNWRLIVHGLPPLPKILTIDTLKEIKAIAKATSNRLDFLGDRLIGSGKMSTPSGTWSKAAAGDENAISLMLKYNKEDVRVLEGVYLKIRAYMKNHPNIAAPSTHDCPKCGSENVKRNGSRIRATGARYQTYLCNSCGANFHDPVVLERPNSRV